MINLINQKTRMIKFTSKSIQCQLDTRFKSIES